jgi:hypothetical protein
LDLDPSYQRRSVWSPKDRRFFLDTIFRGYPSPAIYLHKTVKDGRPTYAVVDGKQRLETVFKFVKNKIRIDKGFGDNRLDSKRWRDISEDADLKRHFWDYVVPVEFINIEGDSELVNNVFDRLNRNSRKLVEQELRHAKFDGWFINFVESQTDEPAWKTLGIATTARAKRMKDVQFISELLIVIFENKVTGFSQEQITEYYAQFEDGEEEEEWEVEKETVVTKFEKSRDYLIELERERGVITSQARDFKNFYSLWGLVALNVDTLPSTAVFAEKYLSFMSQVDDIKNNPQQDITPELISPFNYYEASTGASTEEPQRQKRHIALEKLTAG